jgi:hypothetical protein
LYFNFLNKPISPSPSAASTASEIATDKEYENPFASDVSTESSDITNPFDESNSYTNPFDDL